MFPITRCYQQFVSFRNQKCVASEMNCSKFGKEKMFTAPKATFSWEPIYVPIFKYA